MLFQRKNDSREASSRSLMRYDGSGRRLRRIGFDAKQELRTDEQPVERALDSLRRNSLRRALDDRTRAAARRRLPSPAGDTRGARAR